VRRKQDKPHGTVGLCESPETVSREYPLIPRCLATSSKKTREKKRGRDPGKASRGQALFHLTETQRFQGVVAEAEIGQPNVFEIDAESEVIKFLAGSSLHGRQFSSHISAVWAGVRTSILI